MDEDNPKRHIFFLKKRLLMRFVCEIMCFNSNLAVKMYPKMYIFLLGCTFCNLSVQGPPTPYIIKYFFLGSEQISRMTLKMSKNVEFRGYAEVLQCSTLTLEGLDSRS